MNLVTFAGPPSTGKTGVIIHTIKQLRKNKSRCCVIKFDCLSTRDAQVYGQHGITAKTGLSGGLCPDHFFVCNMEQALEWAAGDRYDYLFTESAGLCNRCSPHIKGVTAVCVIDNLSGVETPRKIGPMLKTADIVVITKGDIVSQAEREVFSFKVRQANSQCRIIHINGITGQGSFLLATLIKREKKDITTLKEASLRFTMPGALCSYCLGERKIGEDKQIGVTRFINFKD